jgi:hypothetical protein
LAFRFLAIIAFYSIGQDIGFLVFRAVMDFTPQPQDIGSTRVFESSSLFTA